MCRRYNPRSRDERAAATAHADDVRIVAYAGAMPSENFALTAAYVQQFVQRLTYAGMCA